MRKQEKIIMSTEIRDYKKKFRIYSKITEEFHGPCFESMSEARQFVAWFDGKVELVGTFLDSRSWTEIINAWKLQTTNPLKRKRDQKDRLPCIIFKSIFF